MSQVQTLTLSERDGCWVTCTGRSTTQHRYYVSLVRHAAGFSAYHHSYTYQLTLTTHLEQSQVRVPCGHPVWPYISRFTEAVLVVMAGD